MSFRPNVVVHADPASAQRFGSEIASLIVAADPLTPGGVTAKRAGLFFNVCFGVTAHPAPVTVTLNAGAPAPMIR